ncbi:SAFB-like transcription modulator [Fukomys damarensis]|uniref:SAFB-like transcription modulator n=1 Tax=Fukomys damarensis TaxID=885580 RepID=A0A091CN11_FUKDA|nr:SAFB-like transcription modulator [Fukomys damarensis]
MAPAADALGALGPAEGKDHRQAGGKNVNVADAEASKPEDGQDTIVQSLEKETKDYEMNVNHKDGKKEDFVKADPVKKEVGKSSKKAESGDKAKVTLKKGPSSTGASGQAKSSSKEFKDFRHHLNMTKKAQGVLVVAVEAQLKLSALVDFLPIPKLLI